MPLVIWFPANQPARSAYLSNENLPLRHRYATEITGSRPGLIRRILNRLGMGKRRNPLHTTYTLNWYYTAVDDDDYHFFMPYIPSSKKP